MVSNILVRNLPMGGDGDAICLPNKDTGAANMRC